VKHQSVAREPYDVVDYRPGDGNRAEFAGALLGALVHLDEAVKSLDEAASHAPGWEYSGDLAHWRASLLEFMHGHPSPGDSGFEDDALAIARKFLPEPTGSHLRPPRYPVYRTNPDSLS
jgi:hypothetical protein